MSARSNKRQTEPPQQPVERERKAVDFTSTTVYATRYRLYLVKFADLVLGVVPPGPVARTTA